MIRSLLPAAAGAVLSCLIAGAVAPALAQYPPPGQPYAFERWQADWDGPDFDRHHVIVATVAGFTPYRLDIRHRDGVLQTIDLKKGTVIRPLGSTPQPGQRVAAIGYWSRGTFVANRIVLRF